VYIVAHSESNSIDYIPCWSWKPHKNRSL